MTDQLILKYLQKYFVVNNTKNQVDAKKMASASYGGKVTSLSSQIQAIENEKNLKLQQAKNKIKQGFLKVKSDSMDLVAVRTQVKIATTQFNRALQLNKEGLKPLTDVEEKRLKLQEVEAKIITQENKYSAEILLISTFAFINSFSLAKNLFS